MGSLRETVFFWIAFGILVPVILSRFYFKTGKKKINQLRYTSVVLQLVALFLLFFFPRHFLLQIYGIALVTSIFFIAFKKAIFNKVGAAISLVNSVFLIIILILLFPEIKILTASDVPMIVSVFVMLSNNVVVLLFWHQLQRGSKIGGR